ncbi:MAG: hypothetical protein ABSF76_01845 [Opitutaceae bacterium]|jgi:hypothetical protein
MTTPTGSDYRDRKTGLVIFGILEIAIGAICGLAILLMLLGQAIASRGSNPPPGLQVLVPVIALYSLMATAFIWLGIGSILARRWARAILLCLSAVALVVGIISCAFMAFVLPHMFDAVAQQSRTALQPAALLMMKVFTAVFMLVFYIIIPGALFLFYRSPHVKRTCEARDPVERWTDRCPLPVLAISLLLGMGGVFVLGVVTRFHVLPFFGTFVSGSAGLALSLVFGGLLLYLACAFYRLQVRAWWIALGIQVLFAISNAVTFWNADLMDMYLKMGFEHRSAAASAQLLASPAFRWMTTLSILPWLIWLLYVRRYFDKPPIPPVLSESEAPTAI